MTKYVCPYDLKQKIPSKSARSISPKVATLDTKETDQCKMVLALSEYFYWPNYDALMENI